MFVVDTDGGQHFTANFNIYSKR